MITDVFVQSGNHIGAHSSRRPGFLNSIVIILIVVIMVMFIVKPGSAEPYDWLQFNFDSQHSGFNYMEKMLDTANVKNLQLAFKATLPAVADGAPVYLNSVVLPDTVRNMLFVTTKEGHIVAIDADNGEQLWVQQNPPGDCKVNNGYIPCYTTSSPALDPGREFVYSYGLDGYVHKYRVTDGIEMTGQGWPQLTTLKAYNEKGSSALSIATDVDGVDYLYVTNGGYLGDRGDYQGHVTAINLSDGSQMVFNANCSNETVHFAESPGEPDCPAVQSAIWARAGVVYYEPLNRIYMATGNGPFDPASYDWGNSVIELYPNGTGVEGRPVDSYTPEDYQQLDEYDIDLGSTAPAILPMPETSVIQHVALQSGKDGKLRLLNLDNLSGMNSPGNVGGQIGPIMELPQKGQVLTAPAVWVDPVDYMACVFIANSRGISSMKITVDHAGIPALIERWTKQLGGTSPIVANHVLYIASNNSIRALDIGTGELLWSDSHIGHIHWESPIVVNGMLYITDEAGNLTAYKIFNGE